MRHVHLNYKQGHRNGEHPVGNSFHSSLIHEEKDTSKAACKLGVRERLLELLLCLVQCLFKDTIGSLNACISVANEFLHGAVTLLSCLHSVKEYFLAVSEVRNVPFADLDRRCPARTACLRINQCSISGIAECFNGILYPALSGTQCFIDSTLEGVECRVEGNPLRGRRR